MTSYSVRLLHKLLEYLSKVAPEIFKSCAKVAHFTKKLLKSCFFIIKFMGVCFKYRLFTFKKNHAI